MNRRFARPLIALGTLILLSVAEPLWAVVPGDFTLSYQMRCDTNKYVAPAVELTWTAAGGVSLYDVYRDGALYSSSGSNLPASKLTYDNTANVTAGQTYTYFVKAKNSSGSTPSNTVTVSVPADICTKVSFVSGFIPDGAPMNPGQSFTQTWTIRNTGYTTWDSTYKLRYISGTLSTSRVDRAIVGSVAPNGTYPFSIDNVAPASTGEYREDWKFVDPIGNTINVEINPTVWTRVLVQGTSPGPFALAGSRDCQSSSPRVSLSWGASSNASSYSVYRNSSLLASAGSAVSYVDSGVSPGTVYSYFVRATNGSGPPAESNPVTVTAPTNCSPAVTVSPTPLNFEAQLGSCDPHPFVIQPQAGSPPASGSVAISGSPFFSALPTSFSATESMPATITIKFCPTASGIVHGAAVVTSNGTTFIGGINSVDLSGNGTQATANGTVVVEARVGGVAWSGLTYSLTGAKSIIGTTPSNLPGFPTGPYSIAYVSGGPPGASLTSISLAATQTLTNGGIVTFTFDFADTTAPQISGVQAANRTATSADILWTTNEPADSQVDWGLTTAYGQPNPVYGSLVTSHRVPLSGLTPGTPYHYLVKSRDAAGNLAPGSDATFTTPALVQGCAADISDASAGAVSLDYNRSISNQCIDNVGDIDWYRVSAGAGLTLRFDLAAPTGRDYALELYGPDASNSAPHQLTGVNAGEAGQAKVLSYTTTAGGDFYIRVYGVGAAYDSSQPYSIAYTPPVEAGLPDLTISASPSSSYVSGQAGVSIPVTVTRTGGSLTAAYVYTALYWSTDSVWDSKDQLIWLSNNGSSPDFPVTVLNSGGSRTVAATVGIPAVPPGKYYLIAYADAPQPSYPSGYHTESNETNNTAVYPINVVASGACADAFGQNHTMAQAYGPITPRLATSGKICSNTESDWFKIDLAGPGKITLSLEVPAGQDYDLELLDATGRTVIVSQNSGGGIAESIGYDAPAAGTYYVRIYGYRGAFDSSQPYILNGQWPTALTTAVNHAPYFVYPYPRYVPDPFSSGQLGSSLSGSNLLGPIPVLGRNGVNFEAIIDDEDKDAVGFQVRLIKPDGSSVELPAPKLVAPGTRIVISTDGLSYGDYSWEFQAFDARGSSTPWTRCGVQGEPCLRLGQAGAQKPALCDPKDFYGQAGAEDKLFLCAADVDTSSLASRIPLILVHGVCLTNCRNPKPEACSGGFLDDYQCAWKTLLQSFGPGSELRSRYKPYLFRYETAAYDILPGLRDVSAIGEWLALKIRAHPDLAGRKFVLVAHSLGGLVSRSFMQEAQCLDNSTGPPASVRCGEQTLALITLASPHHGARRFTEVAAILQALGLSPLWLPDARIVDQAVPDEVDGVNPWLRCLNSYADAPTPRLRVDCQGKGTGYYNKIYALGALPGSPLLDELIPRPSSLFEGGWPVAVREGFVNCREVVHSNMHEGANGGCTSANRDFPFTPLDGVRLKLLDLAGAAPMPFLRGYTDSPQHLRTECNYSGAAQKTQLLDEKGSRLAESAGSSLIWNEYNLTPGSFQRRCLALGDQNQLLSDSNLLRFDTKPVPVNVTLPDPSTLSTAVRDQCNGRVARLQTPTPYGANSSWEIRAGPKNLLNENSFLIKTIRCGWEDTLLGRCKNVCASGYNPGSIRSSGYQTGSLRVSTLAPEEPVALFNGLSPNTTYTLSVVAISATGVVSDSSTAVDLYVPPAPAALSFSTVTGSGRFRGPDGSTTLTLDQIPLASASLFISSRPVAVPIEVSPADLTAANSRMPVVFLSTADPTREFVLYGPDGPYLNQLSGSITLSYPDADNDGIVDGSYPPLREEDLQPYTLVGNRWTSVAGPLVRDPKANTLTFAIEHLSVYTLNGPLASATQLSLNAVRAYPVPWKPGSGNRFDTANAGVCGQGLIFDNLTAEATIRIYNMVGDLVRSLSVSQSNSGCIAWDGKNDSGADVASGIYVAIIKGAGGKVVKKLAIER